MRTLHLCVIAGAFKHIRQCSFLVSCCSCIFLMMRCVISQVATLTHVPQILVSAITRIMVQVRASQYDFPLCILCGSVVSFSTSSLRMAVQSAFSLALALSTATFSDSFAYLLPVRRITAHVFNWHTKNGVVISDVSRYWRKAPRLIQAPCKSMRRCLGCCVVQTNSLPHVQGYTV